MKAAATPSLVDDLGRRHRDLRISVTDRCNLRCTYCMPPKGLSWLPRPDTLTFDEIERLARIFVERFGFSAIRLTGGEPTLRRDLPHLVERLAGLGTDLSMTTNAVTLRTHAGSLASAGLQRVNVSLDTLRPDRFRALTRRDDLSRVLDGIDAAIEHGLSPVKVNAVVMRDVNDDEVVALADFGRSRGVLVRFIEFMPLDATHGWSNEQVVSSAEVVAAVHAVHPLVPDAPGSAPARTWRYVDGGGSIGVISSVTESFCESCDRVRLTADGRLRACLFSTEETDLRDLLRSGATDDDLVTTIRATVTMKGPGHLIGQPLFIRPGRSMSQIGG